MKIGHTSHNMDFEFKKGGRKTFSARHFRRFISLWIAALATCSTEGKKKKKGFQKGGEGGNPQYYKTEDCSSAWQ